MKTYTKTVEITEPRLQISIDQNPTSPREWSNLGYFITVDREYNSPDKSRWLETIVKETGEEADDQNDHIERIKNRIKESSDNEKVEAIYPIYKYEHSGVVYRRGTAKGWDISNNGFYIITDKTAKELGVDKKDFEKVIDNELELFNRYISGEIYCYSLFDKKGELVDSCGGYYSIDDIKEYLPEEWQKEDLSKYLID